MVELMNLQTGCIFYTDRSDADNLSLPVLHADLFVVVLLFCCDACRGRWQCIPAQYMHSMGICHADMSLENTLVDATKTNAFVIDFGMSLGIPIDTCGRRRVGKGSVLCRCHFLLLLVLLVFCLFLLFFDLLSLFYSVFYLLFRCCCYYYYYSYFKYIFVLFIGSICWFLSLPLYLFFLIVCEIFLNDFCL